MRLESLDPRLLLTADPIITFNTSFGSFQVELFADAAPLTVANFLKYVNAGALNDTFIHRTTNVTTDGIGVDQGGGFSAASAPFPPAPSHIASLTTTPLPLESTLGNTAGTIAMARTSDPNSGTSEYFFNVVDDSAALAPGASGGYTVFGQVLGNGLSVLQAINAQQTLNDYFPSYQGSQTDPNNLLGPIPLVNFDPDTATEIDADNLIIVNSVTLAGGSISGTIFDDQDGNGQINGPDAGLSGFTVFIDADDNGQFTAGEASAVTDSSGNYTFSNVTAGNYVVRVLSQTGWTQTSPVEATPAFGAQRFTLQTSQTLTGENFGFAVVLSTPATPVLPSVFDSGSSNSDGKTNLSSLQFVVNGVQAGATITLRDGQNVIGSAVAQGSSVTITPSAAFADGTHSITAAQSLDGQTSSASAVETVVVKTTPPSITSTPPANATVGQPYTYNVSVGSDVVSLSLLNALAGMVAPTLSAPLSWTPTSSQIGPQSVTLVATDVYGNTAHQLISIAVNGPPFFPPIPDQKINQGSTLSFTPTATDLDPLTYSLGAGAPVGVTIDPISGLFTWQPTVSDAPGPYSITIQVKDPGGLTASQVLHVLVNAPPVVGAIAPQQVDEGGTLSFQIPAMDQDALTYQLIGNPPAGVSVSSTGVFTWQPTAAQVGALYNFTVRVTDTGGLSVDQPFAVTVNKISGTFSGTVFVDEAGDGQLDGPDVGEAGFTVYIDANDDGQLDNGDRSTVTDTNGNYSFNALPGAYVLRVAPQNGWAQTSPDAAAPAFGAQRFTLAPNGTMTGENFGLAVVLATPDAPVLPSAFDTGLLNDDGNTNLNSLQFVVNGVQTGATVTLYDGQNVIGSAVAQGVSVTITPSVTFADGSHSITATQTLLGKTSTTSPAREVVVKTTPPVITSTPPDVAIAGTTYTYSVTTSSDTATLNLLNPVAGMVAPTLTTPLTWDPSSGQAGVQTTTLVATDIFGNTAQQTISIAVNAPPSFPPIPDQHVNQGSQLSFTPVATDLDSLMYSLADSAPAGATIDPTTGLITWQTAPDTAPGAYPITVTVIDPGGLSASQVMNVIVNAPPIIDAISTQIVDERTLLSFQIPATDQDALTYQLIGNVPAGATVNSAGLFTWQPTEAQGGVIYNFTVQVTDTGGLSVTQPFQVTVNKVDSPPVIDPISAINVIRGQTVNFVANGADTDLPFAGITYSLDPGAPDGATIDPTTGAFNWQVPANYALGTTTITVRVTDISTNAFSAATQVQIVVGDVPPPVVTPPVVTPPVATPPKSTPPDDGAPGGVDDSILDDLGGNPGLVAALIGSTTFSTNSTGSLPTIPTGPAVLQQLAMVAVDRAVVGFNDIGGRLPAGIIDLLSPFDNGLSHNDDQMAKELAAAGDAGSGAGAGEAQQPDGEASNGNHVQPLDVTGDKNDQPPPRTSVRRGAQLDQQRQRNQRRQLDQQDDQSKFNVAPQDGAWPTGQSFKAQLRKAQALKLEAAKLQAAKAQAEPKATAQQAAAQSAAQPAHSSSETRDELTDSRSNDRNRGQRTTLAAAAMVPLLIGQLEARDKVAERERKKQGRAAANRSGRGNAPGRG
ncbi:MAG TPA: putative Ig domain-containing protein [Pirellulales bacterium]